MMSNKIVTELMLGYPGTCDYIVSGELSPILAVPDAVKTTDPAR
jgi:hypothetical protein